ncbi:uncharacterized protein LOC119767006 [Culex quinquefasciatus]|uniref:uncharacterized protein LOC119767006 n=1 Tax=Culex quinquefasciatus TaxID=7176 RepID=UPI0018E3D776|nr:uncharacterized protein LOC119767006 [Culex quinquefasciatus]
MTTTSIKRDIGRRPDYHIGPNGIPRLTGLRRRKMNSPQQQPLQQPTDPVKLNKCLYNLTVRNGTKIESDIAIRNQYSSKSSSSTCSISDRRSSSTTVASSANRNDPRNTSQQSNYSSPIPRISTSITSSTNNSRNSNGIVMNGSRTLLSGRQQRHQRSATAAGDDAGSNGDGADANLINGSANGDRRRNSSVAMRQYRLSAAIDNRLSYQRKYDRTIFGCNRLDQFVLPPLQI